MSTLTSQLLLHLDTSSPARDGHYLVGESVAMSLCSLAKLLFDGGKAKMAGKVIGLAK